MSKSKTSLASLNVLQGVKASDSATQKTSVTKPKTSGTKGKSADSNYTSTTVYLNKITHAKAKAALLTDNAEALAPEDKRDLSDLIESLLTNWLESR